MNGSVSEELIESRAWLRRLAVSLVGSDDLADDLVQDTYAAALRQPPDPARPVRPWLRQVLRNTARMRWRGQARRTEREREAQRIAAPAEATPEQALAQVRLQRRLAELVEALDEPFREAILLRYVHGLSAADIARRTAVPDGTVRWRVKRGLEQLREGLDRDAGGDGRAWRLALAPAGIPATASTATHAATGVAVMKLVTKISLAVAALGGLIAAGVAVTRAADQRAAPPEAGTGERPALASPAVVDDSTATTITPPAASATAVDEAPSRPRRFTSADERARLLEAIHRAHRERADARASEGTRERERPALRVTAPPKEYIRERVRELLPLLTECYQLALDTDPELAGTLVVDFGIIGDPELGGLVETSDIVAEDSTLQHPAMWECVRETMYALEIDPPEGDGTIRVTYPFEFRPD